MKIAVNMRAHHGQRIARFEAEDIEANELSGDLKATDGKEDIGGGGSIKDGKPANVRMSKENWLGFRVREHARKSDNITRPLEADTW